MAGKLYVDKLSPKPKKSKRRGWLHRLLRRQRHVTPAPTAPLPPLVDEIGQVRPGVWVVVATPDGERIGTVKDFTGFFVRWLDENGEPIGEPFAVHRGSLIEQGTRVRFPDSGKLGQIVEFSAVSVDVFIPPQTISATREQLRPAKLADLPVTVRERTPHD
ncbi:hypothetical protein [Rhodospirillaceae bacterium SYSU D60014]|uniref:hypothetical protein n=1 Tax=Virgifigura deserti TaxID=2268457 RepID=UPI000E662EAC